MGLVLPIAGSALPATPVEDPWDADVRRRRERAVASLVARIRGAGVVSSGATAVWLPPRVGLVDPLEELALRLDAAAYRLAKGRGALDLAIGEILDVLFTAGRLEELGWSRQVDFARERLGLPPRTMYAFLELARHVVDLPELRRAVVRGEVSPLKARAIAPAIRKEPGREAFLLLAARTRTLPEIEKILEDLGGEVPEEPFAVRAKRFRMSAEMQAHLDRAIDLAKSVAGPGRPRWVYEEAIAMEFLAAHALLVPEPVEERPPPPSSSFPPSSADRERLFAEWENRDTQEIEEALRFLLSGETDFLTGKPVETEDPGELEARILRLLSFRKRWDEPFGRILETISTLRLHTFLGYSSFSRYAEERLGVSERGARQRVWLERRMLELPALRMAVRTGRLTYTSALLVAKDATGEDVGRRIREAAETSWQQTERRSTEEEDRQNLAAGIRRIWGPKEAMETVEAAIAVAKEVFFRERGVRITDGEALGLVAAHFVDQWRDPVRRSRLPPLRRRVLARTRGICAAPMCGNPAEHMHHVVHRAMGGPDEDWNCCYLCFSCHRRIHRGRMTVSGRAGERLVWRIRRGAGRWEVWETVGDDGVRRLGEISPLPGGGAR